ncbi:hypothetical protein NBRC10512_007642 [Rhodotorula toruloides]|uniref:RHTO0S05e01200g1_1 n=2 Tax=Rhodotorula toruloides TaxID=5286 RepID=A0A061AY33_RHOTO|nr:uncharacterized protein RHTO_02382 [Rhodotorula toruloides NP11]EMS20766.1 hypothetical protein RHTO_02382 [Rhodotorula toruloides NP11]CDR40309.1 RHTO0S05e01200g1_1 [Rhodotorula toruloides]
MAGLLQHANIKQEPLEATLAATHKVVADFARRAVREMAPSPEPRGANKRASDDEEHAPGGKKAKSNQGKPVHVVKQEEEEEKVDSEVGRTGQSLEQQLEQVMKDVKKANTALGHWKSVVEKTATKVNEERLHKFALECLLRVVDGELNKSESDVSKMQKGVEVLHEQRKRHLHEVNVIQDILARHHAVNGAKMNPLKPYPGQRTLPPGRAAANLETEVKNKAILVEAAKHIHRGLVKAEHNYSIARKHLIEVSFSRQQKVLEAVAIRCLASRAAPQPIPSHL